MSTPRVDVPQELLDRVFCNTDPGDTHVLLQCALLSRPWCHASRRTAFQRQRVRARNVASLLELLQSPLETISEHFKELFIFDHHIKFHTRIPVQMSQLHELLVKLSSLQTLSLMSIDIAPSNYERLRQGPAQELEKLELWRPQFLGPNAERTLADFLALFSEIRLAVVEDVYLPPAEGTEQPEAPSQSTQMPSIRRLSLKYTTEVRVLQTLQRCIRLDQIEAILVKKGSEKLTQLIINDIGEHITSLWVLNGFFNYNSILDLSSRRNIKSLHLGISTREEEGVEESLRYLLRTLATVPLTQLISLKIDITLAIDNTNITLGQDPPFLGTEIEHDLHQLDALISRHEILQDLLVNVELCRFVSGDNEVPYGSWVHPVEGFPVAREYVQRHLPRLAKRGALKLTALIYFWSEDGDPDASTDGSWDA